MDWTRFRTVGIDLLIVGVIVLLVAFGLALYPVCTSPGVCQTAVDLPTLLPGLLLVAAGTFLTIMSRWRRTKAA